MFIRFFAGIYAKGSENSLYSFTRWNAWNSRKYESGIYACDGRLYCVLVITTICLSRMRFYACVESLNAKRVQVIYTDEDKVDETGDYFFAPNFKPDFNIDLLRCNNYICHMFVAEKT